jgi:formylmethanofuran dehydrogenase subunit E
VHDFNRLLAASAEAHGHLCPGQVVGVRMALLGCRLIGLDDPRRRDQIKKLIVYVEMDRCTADAVAFVTGAKLGRRSLKFMDYGIMAATFINLDGPRAFRVISTEEARDLAPLYAPGETDKSRQQIEAYRKMPECVLFRVQKVHVPISPYDLPGPTRSKVTCAHCGQVVRDGKEIIRDGEPLCKPCALGAYFQNPQATGWPEMHRSPDDDAEALPERDPNER